MSQPLWADSSHATDLKSLRVDGLEPSAFLFGFNLIHVLICITMTWKNAGNLSFSDFKSFKVNTVSSHLWHVTVSLENRDSDIDLMRRNCPSETAALSGYTKKQKLLHLLLEGSREWDAYWNREQAGGCSLWKTCALHEGGETWSSIYSGGIIYAQSRPVCGDKTKKILKNVLHLLLRGEKH